MLDKEKILIIENDLDFVNRLAICLQNGGFDVIHVTTIKEGLKLLVELCPPAILVDIQLDGGPFGLDFLQTVLSENSPVDYRPEMIVVSSFITSSVERFLNDKQIMHFNKSLPGFNCSMILKSLHVLIDDSSFSSNTNTSKEGSPQNLTLPTGEVLKKIISEKLSSYDFDVKSTGYKRLVKGIYYTLLPESYQEDSLVSIYRDVLKLSYDTAFNSITRSIHKAFKGKPAPTPTDFINEIVAEIRKDYS